MRSLVAISVLLLSACAPGGSPGRAPRPLGDHHNVEIAVSASCEDSTLPFSIAERQSIISAVADAARDFKMAPGWVWATTIAWAPPEYRVLSSYKWTQFSFLERWGGLRKPSLLLYVARDDSEVCIDVRDDVDSKDLRQLRDHLWNRLSRLRAGSTDRTDMLLKPCQLREIVWYSGRGTHHVRPRWLYRRRREGG
jgi:hypothetical protein